MARSERPFLDLWLPSSALGEPEEERVGRLIVASAATAAVFSVILAASRFGLEGEASRVGRVLLLSGLAFVLAPFVMRLSGSVRLGSVLVPVVGLISLLAMALLDEGLRSEALYWVPFVPLVAAMVSGGRAAVVFGLLCFAATTGLAWLHFAGIEFTGPPLVGRPLLLHLAAASTAPLFGAFLGWFYESQRRRTGQSLDAMRLRSAALLSALPDAMVRVRADGTIQDLEIPVDAAPRVRGTELLGRRLEDVLPEAVAKRVLEQIRQTLNTGRLTTREYRMPFDGEPMDIELRAVPHGRFEVVGIVRDVTQRKRLDAMRDDFVATVSHELRTPLTSIHGSLRLIVGGAVGELPPEAKELAEVASSNSERLRRLIDDLLDMGKMEAGELELRFETVDLQELLEQSVRANQGYADSDGVRLELARPLPPARVEVDPDRLQQVMANLLSNAIKYSPKGEPVTVTLEVRGARAEISVSDRGPGIDEAFRPRVFQRFAQADSGSARSVRGTGLGLAICKRLVEEFGGRIGFETELGHGTRFHFELPLVRVADEDA